MDWYKLSNFSGVYEVGVGLNLGFAIVSEFSNVLKRSIQAEMKRLRILIEYEDDDKKKNLLNGQYDTATILYDDAFDLVYRYQMASNLILLIFSLLCLFFLIFSGFSQAEYPSLSILVSIFFCISPVPISMSVIYAVTRQKTSALRFQLKSINRILCDGS